MDKQQGPTVYSTGNYIQYPVVNHHGKEHEKECIYIYFATQQKLTQHCKSTILQLKKKKRIMSGGAEYCIIYEVAHNQWEGLSIANV